VRLPERTGFVSIVLGVAAFAAATGCSNDRIEPPPSEVPHVSIKLPPSAHDYYAHESGGQHSMDQVRFEISPSDIPLLISRLSCRVGAVQVDPPVLAVVGTNDRRWYVPEAAKKDRGCEYQSGLTSGSFLIDLSEPTRAIFYAVISRE